MVWRGGTRRLPTLTHATTSSTAVHEGDFEE